ncbi:hypothetical protein SLS62_006323 [Diatrype stigma]|uniref:LPXTG-domain-containing protein n=1 Tax=Diatrype stigma TaxID=117547 RepID=A0AAN9UPV9_9PEZI
MGSHLLRLTLTLTLLTRHTAALQVTPNSPCASFCVDSNDLDFSDPNSSNTDNKDITCYDSEYTSSPAGQKFERCISCLQDSTFSQDDESDQLWFLYNLRYTFDYCIFGFPDAKDVASTPCSTETACGDLQAALTSDRLSGDKVDYSFCSADGGAMAGPAVEKCLACVGASDDQDFLANYVVALDAGCKQQPPTGTLVGLNDTVFSKSRIGAADPESEAADDHAAMPMGTTVGIVVGAVVIVLVVAGISFVCCRKRRNKRLRLEGSRSSGLGSQLARNGPASPLSFRCQTHVTPRSPEFHRSITGTTTIQAEEKVYPGPYSATWTSSRPYSVSPVSPPMSPASMWPMPSPSSDDASRSSPHLKQDRAALHSITTTTTTAGGPKFPGYVHYSASPKASGMAPFSPVDEDIAPPSTVSTRSTVPLLLPQLKPYNPAEYASAPSPYSQPPHQHQAAAGSVSTPESTYTSPTSGSTASPLLSRVWDNHHQRTTTPAWDVPQQQQRGPGRPNLSGAFGRATLVVTGKGRRVSGSGSGAGNGNGSPVETTQINTVFAAPPTRR